jgi:ribosomal protein S18 acetylase RimI-like enzyme
MAALVDPARHLPAPELRDLRSLRAHHLHELLEEEAAVWEEALDWDFEKSAALVRKFVDLQALNGAALVNEEGVIGYAYYVVEDRKGLIGDVFVRRPFQTAALEQRLLDAMVDELFASQSINRIESQLMLLRAPLERPIAGARYFQLYPRDFLIFDTRLAQQLLPRGLTSRVEIARWAEPHQEPAAQLIAATYQGHVDSQINDQYRSTGGARRFLYNIVQYPGCGTFFMPASFSAFSTKTGELCGMCLASLVSDASGHITQVCVAPKWQGEGLGYELLRQSIDALVAAGCRKISLTVTSENRQAMILYRSLGFEPVRHFAAYVWDGW